MRILNLYPNLLHTNGCSGSALALKKRLKWREIDAEELVFTTSDNEFPSEFDFIIIGDGSPRETDRAAVHLTPFAPQIKAFIESGGTLFASGSGFSILGRIGALDIKVSAAKSRIIGDILVKTDLFDDVLIGFENHVTAVDIGDYPPLGIVTRGGGNNGEDGRDGLIYKNTVCTNAGGPALAKNPKLCDYLIQTIIPDLLPLDDTVENAARQFILDFLAENAVSDQAKCIEL